MPEMVSFRALQGLRLVARHGSFAAAARELGVTRAGLSQSISALERSLNVMLVDRSARPLTVTMSATLIIDHVQAAIDEFDAALAELTGTGKTVEVTVAYTLTTEGQFATRLIEHAREKLPHVKVSLRRLWTAEASVAVTAGVVDIAVTRHPPWSVDLRVEKLWDTALVLRAPNTHRLALRSSVSLTELAGEPLFVVPRELSPGSYDLVESAMLAAGVAPRLVTTPVAYTRFMDQDTTSSGATLGPRVTPAEVAPGFVQIPLEGPGSATRMGVHAVTRYTDRNNITIEALLHVLRDIARTVQADDHTR